VAVLYYCCCIFQSFQIFLTSLLFAHFSFSLYHFLTFLVFSLFFPHVSQSLLTYFCALFSHVRAFPRVLKNTQCHQHTRQNTHQKHTPKENIKTHIKKRNIKTCTKKTQHIPTHIKTQVKHIRNAHQKLTPKHIKNTQQNTPKTHIKAHRKHTSKHASKHTKTHTQRLLGVVGVPPSLDFSRRCVCVPPSTLNNSSQSLQKIFARGSLKSTFRENLDAEYRSLNSPVIIRLGLRALGKLLTSPCGMVSSNIIFVFRLAMPLEKGHGSFGALGILRTWFGNP
jgi:hypothetical protein